MATPIVPLPLNHNRVLCTIRARIECNLRWPYLRFCSRKCGGSVHELEMSPKNLYPKKFTVIFEASRRDHHHHPPKDIAMSQSVGRVWFIYSVLMIDDVGLPSVVATYKCRESNCGSISDKHFSTLDGKTQTDIRSSLYSNR